MITDATGVVIDRITYDGYGNIIAETNPSASDRYLWTGREFDRVTGLQYNRARYYDPTTGRWTSKDPIGFYAGDTNLDRYVNNDATDATDPDGEWFQILAGAGVGFLVGVASQGVSDLLSGKVSSLTDYTAAGVGGAVGGAVLAATGNPTLAGAAGGAASNLTRQTANLISGKQTHFDPGSLLVETGFGALGGKIGGAVGNRVFNATASRIGTLPAATVSGLAGGAAGGGAVGGINGFIQNGWQGILPGIGHGAVVGGAGGALGGYLFTRFVSNRSTIRNIAGLYRNTPNRNIPGGPGMRRPGVVALFRKGAESFSGRSGFRGNPIRSLQSFLRNLPPNLRSAFHGRCAEIDAISQAIENGINPSGGTLETAAVSTGEPIPPCASCQQVLNYLGIRYVSGFNYLFFLPRPNLRPSRPREVRALGALQAKPNNRIRWDSPRVGNDGRGELVSVLCSRGELVSGRSLPARPQGSLPSSLFRGRHHGQDAHHGGRGYLHHDDQQRPRALVVGDGSSSVPWACWVTPGGRARPPGPEFPRSRGPDRAGSREDGPRGSPRSVGSRSTRPVRHANSRIFKNRSQSRVFIVC